MYRFDVAKYRIRNETSTALNAIKSQAATCPLLLEQTNGMSLTGNSHTNAPLKDDDFKVRFQLSIVLSLSDYFLSRFELTFHIRDNLTDEPCFMVFADSAIAEGVGVFDPTFNLGF